MSNKAIADALGIEPDEDSVNEQYSLFGEYDNNDEDVGKEVSIDTAISTDVENDPITEMFGEEKKIGHVDEDYEFTRHKMRNILQTGEEALNNLMRMVDEDPSARGYEVVSSMLKTLTDMGSQFFELQKKNKDLHQGDLDRLGTKPSNFRIQNGIVLTGDSSSTLEYLRQRKKETDENK